MKTILFFAFCKYYPAGGGNDLRRVIQVEGEFTPELIFEHDIPLDYDFVNAVIVDERGQTTTRQYTVMRGATREEGELAEAAAFAERPRWDRDASPLVGLVPRFR